MKSQINFSSVSGWIVLFLSVLSNYSLFAQELVWARDSKSCSYAQIMSMCTDQSANVYVGGYYTDSLVVGNVKLIGSGINSGFILKLDPNGVPLWGLNFKAPGGSQNISSLSLTNNGAIIFSGTFSSPSLTVGANVLHGVQGTASFFVGKVLPNGIFSWVKHGTGIWAHAFSKCVNNSIYVSNVYNGAATLTLGTIPLSGFGGMDACVIKYDTLGNQLWYKTFGGPNDEYVTDLAIASNGDCMLAGNSTSSLIACDATTLNLASVSNSLIPFVVKYTGNGTYSGSLILPSLKHLSRLRIATDGSGYSVIGGQMAAGVSQIGSNSYSTNVPTGFITRINPQLIPVWTNTTSAFGSASVKDIQCDAMGRVYACGLFEGDSLGIGNQYLKNDSTLSSVFFSIFDPSGTLVKSKLIGGKYYESQANLCFNDTRYYIATAFQGKFSMIESTQISNPSTLLLSGKFIVAAFQSPFLQLKSLTALTNPLFFPNPCHSSLKLQHSSGFDKVLMLDEKGRCILQKSIEANETELDISALPSGLFILHLSGKNKVFTGKVVKE